mmetsp:Transcript_14723/g.26748  ORF Transcript_14723/g.26748 Transcript_14723/m.26748 type:complete len:229 (-) Transcript_14723:73-759(-)
MMRVPRCSELFLSQIRQDTPHSHDIAIQTSRFLDPVANIPERFFTDNIDLVGTRRGKDFPRRRPIEFVGAVESVDPVLIANTFRTRSLHQGTHSNLQKRLASLGSVISKHAIGNIPLAYATRAIIATAKLGRQSYPAFRPTRIVRRPPQSASVDLSVSVDNIADHAPMIEARAYVVMVIGGIAITQWYEHCRGHERRLEGDVGVGLLRWRANSCRHDRRDYAHGESKD